MSMDRWADSLVDCEAEFDRAEALDLSPEAPAMAASGSRSLGECWAARRCLGGYRRWQDRLR